MDEQKTTRRTLLAAAGGLLLSLAILPATTAEALSLTDPPGRIYDEKGRYQGRVKETESSTMRAGATRGGARRTGASTTQRAATRDASTVPAACTMKKAAAPGA